MLYSLPLAVKKVTQFFLFVLIISVFVTSTALARESIARYPSLPAGYTSIKVFDHKNRYVGRLTSENRYWVPLDRVPPFLQKALVAIEDVRFYEHGGIDIRGIARALMKDVVKGKMAEGGSTITQQLIKNKYLTGEKTLDRKLTEARLAMEYERKYSKKQILEMYFNEIYYGNGAWGIAQAARFYFDKTPEQLNESECALLAGVPKAPGRYNPLGNRLAVGARRNLVLSRMAELGIITQRQKNRLAAQPIVIARRSEAPYYLAHIRHKLIERYGAKVIEQGGLDVISAMDLPMQKLAEQAIREGVEKISPELEGALLCLDPVTGNILAAVGGVDYKKSAYNRAFFARRQPGSVIKPLIYAAALEKDFTASSLMNDSPVTYSRGDSGTWTPQNYGKQNYGEISLRQALAYSNNIITVKLLEAIGVPYFTGFAGKLGLSLHSANGLSLALGSDDVTLHDLVSAYAPFASGGLQPESRTILKVYDRNRQFWTEYRQSVSQVLSPAVAYVTTQMLKDVMTYGTAKSLEKFSKEHPSAGKTGTTNDYRDAWFVGYTPRLVTGVWVGYDKPRPGGKGFTGGAVSAPIWGRFMRAVLAADQKVDFSKPDTVVSAMIDPATGYLATPDCPDKREEYYLERTEPTVYCPEHGGAAPPEEAPIVTPEAGQGDKTQDIYDGLLPEGDGLLR
ncbi:MAG: PBP1A family penicillin-binding protein [Deltaproteobacteria bacterium]|nr:PBP1A family penicillin-binding protein [Deltaproteobacteria bacterium]TLN02070.1 MAG: PBP1A family penicillin-binding protein [bacterium]